MSMLTTSVIRSYQISLVIRQSFFFQKQYQRDLWDCLERIALWDCLGGVKLVLYQNFMGLIQLLVVILERGKPHLIAEHILYINRL